VAVEMKVEMIAGNQSRIGVVFGVTTAFSMVKRGALHFTDGEGKARFHPIGCRGISVRSLVY
jgi:hypothetical protein